MRIYNILRLFGLLLLINACTGDFEETNTHPNNLQDITPGSTLNPVIYGLARRNALQMRTVTSPLMQVFSRTDDLINSPFLYDFDPNIGNSTWGDYYKWLNNIREMEMAAVREEMPNYEAIALTLKAYAFSVLTDCFGDVPADMALLAEEGTWYPEFMPQQEIYEMLLDDLERANSLYNDEEMIYVEDILYHNDVNKWKKFTNSLHMRLLLRISGRDTDAFSRLTAIVNNPAEYPVFESNDDGAVLQIDGVPPLLSPWDRPQDFNTFRSCSEFFIDNLRDFEDPRLEVFATVARGLDDENYGYIGQPVDFIEKPLPDSIATASGIQQSLAREPMIVPVLSYAEVEFIKAELAQRGYINDAEAHYKNGVAAAIEMWGLEMPVEQNDAGEVIDPEVYFKNEHTEYNGTLQRILLQKYYALFFTDYQAWFEQRRTGFPELPVSSSMLNGGEMPVRFYYPINEADRNNENYKAAVERMGGDEINVRVWWDVD